MSLRLFILGVSSLLLSALVRAADLPDAAEKKDWSAVASLLESKADPNAKQADGMTALHWAATHDQTDIARKLLSAGANASVTNAYGVSALSLACQNGNEALVSSLLDAGANANTTLKGGETVLMIAARTGRAGAISRLLSRGARIDVKDRKGQTALMWAAAEGHVEAVELLVKSGADVHAKVKSGFTPLLFAVREGRIAVVRSLIKAGVKVNLELTSEKSLSPLLLAVENGHFELAVALLEAGADPNDDRSGFTPLHTLTWVRKPNRGDDEAGQPPPEGSGKITSLQFPRELVKHGAKVNARLARGKSGRGDLGMPGATAFLLASKTADLPLMKLLIELGADPLLPNNDGTTTLMAAAGLGTRAPDEEAGTEEECIEAARLLIDLGADVNAVSANGETAMHGAAYKSLPKMVAFLSSKGAQLAVWNHKNKWGWTPTMIAEGFRVGNFKPSAETLTALHQVMREAGVKPPPPTLRTDAQDSEYGARKTDKSKKPNP